MPTPLHSLKPMLWTDKIEDTIVFYRDVLGFKIDEYSEDWGWAHISRDGVDIMLAKPNEHEDFHHGPKFTGSFYITVEDVDILWHSIKDKARICYSIDNFDYGMRDFAIFDNNGYTLQFGSEIKS